MNINEFWVHKIWCSWHILTFQTGCWSLVLVACIISYIYLAYVPFYVVVKQPIALSKTGQRVQNECAVQSPDAYHWSLRTVICRDHLTLTSSFTPCSGLIEDSLRPAIKFVARQHVSYRFVSTQDNLPVLANPEPHHRAIASCQLSCSTVQVTCLLAQSVHMKGTPQHGHPRWTWCNAWVRSEALIVVLPSGLV